MALKSGRVGVNPTIVDALGKIKSSAISIAKGSKSVFGILKVGNNLNVNSGVISAPIASTSAVGVVKVGDGLAVTEDGTLSAQGGGGAELYSHNIEISFQGNIELTELNFKVSGTIVTDSETQFNVSTLVTYLFNQGLTMDSAGMSISGGGILDSTYDVVFYKLTCGTGGSNYHIYWSPALNVTEYDIGVSTLDIGVNGTFTDTVHQIS